MIVAAINLEAEGSKQLRFVHLTPAQGIVTARIFTQGNQMRVTVTADLDVPLVRTSGTSRDSLGPQHPSRSLTQHPSVSAPTVEMSGLPTAPFPHARVGGNGSSAFWTETEGACQKGLAYATATATQP